MDTKKVLQTLIKIADQQQKIINKLAQQQGLAEPLSLTQHMDANPVSKKEPAAALMDALPSTVKPNISKLQTQNTNMLVSFLPGKATQSNYDAVLKTMQHLTDQGVFPHPFSLKVV